MRTFITDSLTLKSAHYPQRKSMRAKVARIPLSIAAILAVAGTAFGQTSDKTIPQNLHLLVGKRVVVGRMILCVPNTYSPNLSYAGKTATVMAFKENTTLTTLPPSVLNRLSQNIRANLEDIEKGGILSFQFQDGTSLDTCSNQGVSALTPNLELAAGETITYPEAQTNTNETISRPIPSISSVTQQCPIDVIGVSSGVSVLHFLLDTLTTSEFQQQLDETLHDGHQKHYLDMRMRNDSDKLVAAFEMTAVYANKMGDESGSSTFVSQNSGPLKPGSEYTASAMDRSEWTQNGSGEVKLFISRVRFTDNTYWQDDGSHSCARSTRSN